MRTADAHDALFAPSRRRFVRNLVVGSVTSMLSGFPWRCVAAVSLGEATASGLGTTPALRLRPADFEPLALPFGAVRLGFHAVTEPGPLPPILVVHDHGRYRALSAECTHAGCLIPQFNANRVAVCPCHGSRYAADGSVIFGPAEFPLPSYPVDIDSDGTLRIALHGFPPVELALAPLTVSGRVPVRFLATRNVRYEVTTRTGPTLPWQAAAFALSDATPADQHELRGTGHPVTIYLETPGPGAWIQVSARARIV